MPRELPDSPLQNNPAEAEGCTVSGYPGVCWSKHHGGRWQAYIAHRGRQKNLGLYDDLNDAVNARLRAEEELAMGCLFPD
jgi:hypothetical protein